MIVARTAKVKQLLGKRVDEPSEISLNIRKKVIKDGIGMVVNRYGRRFEVQLKLEARP
jgi:hypothetical protein